MLDLAEIALGRSGFGFQRIDGKQAEARRRSVLEEFRKNVGCSILLASIGSAGVGYVIREIFTLIMRSPEAAPG